MIEIVRNYSDDTHVSGNLILSSPHRGVLFTCKTIELPNLNNGPGISCIPAGVYFYEKVKQTLAIPYPHINIRNVPNRLGIAIHVGNYVHGVKIESKGCIFVGTRLVDINADNFLDIAQSKDTFKKLMSLIQPHGMLKITAIF